MYSPALFLLSSFHYTLLKRYIPVKSPIIQKETSPLLLVTSPKPGQLFHYSTANVIFYRPSFQIQSVPTATLKKLSTQELEQCLQIKQLIFSVFTSTVSKFLDFKGTVVTKVCCCNAFNEFCFVSCNCHCVSFSISYMVS